MVTNTRRIGILLFNGVTALDAVGPIDAFAAAQIRTNSSGEGHRPAYELVTIGLDGDQCIAESGLIFQTSHLPENAPALDTLIVPGGHGLREAETNHQAVTFILAHEKHIRRIATVCTGIFGVAPTGLLDGRKVTTHWRFAEAVAARFPKLELDPDKIYVRDGKYYSSGGVTAGIDLALALIEEDLGATAALAVARELVVYIRRSGGQQQFSEPLRFQHRAHDRLGDLVAYIAAHLREDLSPSALAQRVALSERQFSRKCRDVFGCTPATLVTGIRLDEAREHLLVPGATVESVADCVGYHSADVFRRAFERRFGIAPLEFRRRFALGEGTVLTSSRDPSLSSERS